MVRFGLAALAALPTSKLYCAAKIAFGKVSQMKGGNCRLDIAP
jgi:hypothetical protein